MKKMTLGEVKEEFGVNMKVINDFLHTFEFHSPYWANYSKFHYLSYDTVISDEMVEFLRTHAQLIRAFKKDYDAAKSVYQIAQKTGLEPLFLMHYLNNYSCDKTTEFNSESGNGVQELIRAGIDVTNLSNTGKITLKTHLRNISSYQILKEVQLYKRRRILLDEFDINQNPY